MLCTGGLAVAVMLANVNLVLPPLQYLLAQVVM